MSRARLFTRRLMILPVFVVIPSGRFKDKFAQLDEKAAELFGKSKTWGDIIRMERKLPKASVSFWGALVAKYSHDLVESAERCKQELHKTIIDKLVLPIVLMVFVARARRGATSSEWSVNFPKPLFHFGTAAKCATTVFVVIPSGRFC